MSDSIIFKKVKEFADNSILDEILVFALLIVIVESIAQNTLKNSEYGSFKFILGIIFYIFVGYILHYAYHNVPLGKLNVIWSCMSIILAISIGYLLYNEPFNMYTLLSIICALAAIYFAKLSGEYIK